MKTLSPVWYAIGATFAVPMVVAVLVFGALFILACWPITPWIAYRQRQLDLEGVE